MTSEELREQQRLLQLEIAAAEKREKEDAEKRRLNPTAFRSQYLPAMKAALDPSRSNRQSAEEILQNAYIADLLMLMLDRLDKIEARLDLLESPQFDVTLEGE